jgi:hypothetical protein
MVGEKEISKRLRFINKIRLSSTVYSSIEIPTSRSSNFG